MISYNYLDLLNAREQTWIPIHFSKIDLSTSESLNLCDLKNWIITKLSGRFYLNRTPTISNETRLKSSIVLGFEEEKELTYFLLACPFLRRN